VGSAVRVPLFRGTAETPASRHPATVCDFAGEVKEVGRDVAAFRAGDRLWGFDDNFAGTHAQYVAFAANKAITTIPAGDRLRRSGGLRGGSQRDQFLAQGACSTGEARRWSTAQPERSALVPSSC
jgi:hypothetical protein